MKSDKTFSGVTPDYGTILRVNTRVTSEETAALMEQLAIYDSCYLGGHIRPVRRAVFIDRPMFGLSMMANNIPIMEVKLATALQAFKPYDALNEFDAILEQLGGSSHAPSVMVIPCTTLLANGYKFADDLIQSQNAWYQTRASFQTGGPTGGRGPNNPVTSVTFQLAHERNPRTMPSMPLYTLYTAMSHIDVSGEPTRPAEGCEPYADGDLVLLPVMGQGPAPFLVSHKRLTHEFIPITGVGRDGQPIDYNLQRTKSSRNPNYKIRTDVDPDTNAVRGLSMSNVIPLRWAIFYQEQDAVVDSPIRKVAMIAFLNHLFDYLDGRNLLPSQYQWPTGAGTGSAPYSPTTNGHTGHDILNRLLAETVRAAALRLENMEAAELPQSTEMQLIRAVANLMYLLDHRDVLIKALCNSSAIRQFFALLLESQLIQNGAQISVVRNSPNDAYPTDLQYGVAPRESCDFLWHRILTLLPQDVFATAAISAVTGGVMWSIPSSADYDKLLLNLPPLVDDTQIQATQASAIGRTLVKQVNMDMKADFIAAAILNRMRESVPVIISLLKGEIPGFEHLHVAAPDAALSMEVTLNILESIQLMLDRDLLVPEDCLEWEEPYSGAHFSTAWQAFSVKFPTYPIEYVIHNLAVDYLRDLALVTLPAADSANNTDAATAVARAFEQVGLTMVQCEPVMTYTPLGTAPLPTLFRTYMRGELAACGRIGPNCANELCGDFNVSHGALRVTSTYYVRSATIWNQMMEMPRQVVARAYNPQLVPRGWHDFARLDVTAGQLAAAVAPGCEGLATAILARSPGTAGFTHYIDLNPAFRDVGIVLPYVQMMVQTPPEAYDFTMYSKVVFETDQRICNITGTPAVLQQSIELPGVPAWAMPNLATQMAYKAQPITHMILPLSWNATR